MYKSPIRKQIEYKKGTGIHNLREDEKVYAKEHYTLKKVFQLQCHVLTIYRKRQGLLCGIEIKEINEKLDNVKKFTATSTPYLHC